MVARFTGLVAGLALLFTLTANALGQVNREDYRQFFKPPDTVEEYYKAIQFEIELGSFKTAALYLRELIKKEPGEKELVALEEKEGMSSFLRLRLVKWSDDPKVDQEAKKNAEELIERVTAAVKKNLSDPARIAKLVNLLKATPHERLYAIKELRRSSKEAMPALAQIMLLSKNSPEDLTAIFSALPYLTREAVPPLLAMLDIEDPVIQVGIMGALMRRDDFSTLTRRPEHNPIPYFWHLAESPKRPDAVRALARKALASLYEVHPEKLPIARVELTREAEKYYKKQVRFADPKAVTVWFWNGKELNSVTLQSNFAEEFYGLRYAGQAIDLDPLYEPAQVVLLSLAVENGVERAGLDTPLSKAQPGLHELLATINPDLIIATLERGLTERRRSVVLGCVRALGELAEVRAARSKQQGFPPLVKAMSFPDRRVQLAAADALLRIPGQPPPQASGRVVEILRRMVESDPVSKVLVVDFNQGRAKEVAQAVKEAGFEPVLAQTGKEALARLREASDIDLILLDYQTPDPLLADLMVQIRADIDTAMIPVLVTIPPTAPGFRPPADVIGLARMLEHYRNVAIVPASNDPELLKKVLADRMTEAHGQQLSAEERKQMAAESMVWLRRIATGESPGYNAAPASSAILKALRNEDLAYLAAEAAGRLPGRDAQRELATVVLEPNLKPELRAAAAAHLVRSIQLNSMVLGAAQARGLEDLYAKTQDNRLKPNLALVVGAMRPNAVKTGDRLQRYNPTIGAAPPPAEKKEEEKKEK